MERILESFRIVGASELADLLQATSFCRDIIARTAPDAHDRECTREEEGKLTDVELRISAKGPDAFEGRLAFLPPGRS